ncbi:ABC transporter ATP-binding protein, partial [Agrococcus sp. HG114]|uniref:ATP-binding cassette domain-containing protein n=1 Tax=Agrococcus sp. HG114 TaxID=2969757 RepID=UPI00215A6C56
MTDGLGPSGAAGTVAAAGQGGAVAGDLEVHGLSVRARERVLVDDVSWSAPAGRITALVGPNGAGKSTMLRAIVGVVPERGRRDGRVLLGG